MIHYGRILHGHGGKRLQVSRIPVPIMELSEDIMTVEDLALDVLYIMVALLGIVYYFRFFVEA